MVRTPLAKHQERIVTLASPSKYFGIFAGYGSGKTLCALKIIDLNGWKIIFVISTKKAIETTWPDEIRAHTDFFFVQLIGDSKEKLRIIRNAFARFAAYTGKNKPTVIFLTNFDGVKNVFRYLTAIKPQAIFVDESTKIKVSESLRTKVMWALGKYVPNRYLMTGFPVTDNPVEIYSQVKFLDQGATFGNSYEAWLKEYFKKKNGKWKLKPGAWKKIYNKIKDFCIMIPDVEEWEIDGKKIKLPPKSYRDIGLTPYDEQRKLLNQLRDDAKVEFGNVKISFQSAEAICTKALQICDGFIFDRNKKVYYFATPKDEALIDILEEYEIGPENKVVIFTTFIPTIVKLYKLLSRFGYGVLTLYGGTEDAGRVLKAFQSSSKYSILLATIFSGDASLTITAARHAIYYSHFWSNEKRGNSEARIRRKGSERHKGKTIQYTDFYLKGTIEELVRKNVKSKTQLVAQLKKYFLK